MELKEQQVIVYIVTKDKEAHCAVCSSAVLRLQCQEQKANKSCFHDPCLSTH
jgi:hypothetical protein